MLSPKEFKDQFAKAFIVQITFKLYQGVRVNTIVIDDVDPTVLNIVYSEIEDGYFLNIEQGDYSILEWSTTTPMKYTSLDKGTVAMCKIVAEDLTIFITEK